MDEVYPGIDLVVRGNGHGVEYDFLVAPGAEASQIRLGFDGAEAVSLDPSGDLRLQLPGGDLIHRRPRLFQQDGSVRRPVEGRFVVEGAQVSFHVGPYDATRPLVIDPELVYWTYLNFGDLEADFTQRAFPDIALDPDGNLYLLTQRSLTSTNLDVVVRKLNRSGTAILYTFVVGSSGDDQPQAIDVDSDGAAYFITSAQMDFPLVNPFSSSFTGYALAKVNPAGDALVYSTFAPGVTGDVAVNGSGEAHVGGNGSSIVMPLVNAAIGSCGPGTRGYLATYDSAGSALIFSTFLCGPGPDARSDSAVAVAVDSVGNVFVGGNTGDPAFPTTQDAVQSEIAVVRRPMHSSRASRHPELCATRRSWEAAARKASCRSRRTPSVLPT